MDKLLVVWFLFCVFHIPLEAKSLHPTQDKSIELIECTSTERNQWEQQYHPTICGWFVLCMNDIGIVSQCPDNLLFNKDLEICDLPENVNCDDLTTTTATTTTDSEDSTIDTTLIETTETTTSDFTNEDDTTIDTTIATDTTENQEDTTTEQSETTNMDTDSTVENDSEWTTESVTGAYCEPLCAGLQASFGEIADPDHCDRLISCTDHCLGGTMFCPSGLHFNHIISTCDLPERAECLLEVCVGQPNGYIPSVNSCHHYFICTNSNAILEKCEDELVFDPVLKSCVTAENHNNECMVLDIPKAPTEFYSECSANVADQSLRHPTRCDVFYRCVGGMLSSRICLEGLFFDEALGMCNIAELVDCTNDTEQQ